MDPVDAPRARRAAGASVAAVALLGVGAAAVTGRALNPLLEVIMPLVLLVPIKVPVAPRPVVAAVAATPRWRPGDGRLRSRSGGHGVAS